MKKRWFSFITMLLLFGCRQQMPVLHEDTLFNASITLKSDPCIPGEQNYCDGNLMLKKNGKALFYEKCSDTVVYYRGAYFLSDSGVQCNFYSAYTTFPACKNCPGKKKERGRFRDTAAWVMRLKSGTCPDRPYIADAPPGGRALTGLLFTKSSQPEYMKFCNFISLNEVFIDFHCKADTFRAESPTSTPLSHDDEIVNYYRRQFTNCRVTVSRNDSAVEMTIFKRKTDLDDANQVVIRINSSRAIKGDLNGDNEADEVVVADVNEEGVMAWQELFVFIRSNGKNGMTASATDSQLAMCVPGSYGGSFHPREIKDGILKGISVCYTDEDAECCPSVKNPSGVVYENKQLKPLNQPN